MAEPLYMHGTCVSCGARAVLLRGPSGSGKSDLAFRLIREDPSGETRLVADDQVALHVEPPGLVASAPAALAGLLELRGLGLVAVPRGKRRRWPDRRSRRARRRAASSRSPLRNPAGSPFARPRAPRFRRHRFLKLRLALETLPDSGFQRKTGVSARGAEAPDPELPPICAFAAGKCRLLHRNTCHWRAIGVTIRPFAGARAVERARDAPGRLKCGIEGC